jgi:hypothetical protein
MDRHFKILRQNRGLFISLLNSLSIEQINEIPPGFNNNIGWNFAHINSVMQAINYTKASVQGKIPQEIVDRYQRGTRPEQFIDETEMNFQKQMAVELVDEMEKDWNSGLLVSYSPFKTSLGVSIESNLDALIFTGAHDFLHMGYAWALKRLVLSKK